MAKLVDAAKVMATRNGLGSTFMDIATDSPICHLSCAIAQAKKLFGAVLEGVRIIPKSMPLTNPYSSQSCCPHNGEYAV